MSGPRTKRPFAGAARDPSQRQITAFFAKSATPNSGGGGGHDYDGPALSQAAPLNGPVLPATVQSNLLSVGMRVRKSVVEGYKTAGSESAFSLWSDTTPICSSNGTSTPHELAPFCGILKVGGLAVQPVAVSPSPPSSSQESVSSTTSAMEAMERSLASTTRKRFFSAEDDETEALPAPHGGPWRHRDEWIDGEISPRSFAPAGWGNARIMAVPRSRKGRNGPEQRPSELDQENMAVDVNDFEEAPFLDMEME